MWWAYLVLIGTLSGHQTCHKGYKCLVWLQSAAKGRGLPGPPMRYPIINWLQKAKSPMGPLSQFSRFRRYLDTYHEGYKHLVLMLVMDRGSVDLIFWNYRKVLKIPWHLSRRLKTPGIDVSHGQRVKKPDLLNFSSNFMFSKATCSLWTKLVS